MQQPLDVIVVAEEDDLQAVGRVLKHKTQVQPGAALVRVVPEFANAHAQVQVGLAKFFGQPGQRQLALVPGGFVKTVERGLHMGMNEDAVRHEGRALVRGVGGIRPARTGHFSAKMAKAGRMSKLLRRF